MEDPTGDLVKRSALLVAWLACALLVKAQEASTLVARGDAAARSDRHAEAVKYYEQAIRVDPGARSAVLPKLGRQYLWSNQPAKAAQLLADRLQSHPADCDARLDFALALSWAGRLSKSREAYRQAARACPGRKMEARLGEARVLRWRGQPGKAEAIYREVLRAGQPSQRQDARLGMALDSLALDSNRHAQQMLAQLIGEGSRDPAAYEGEAVSTLRLGLPDRAAACLKRARQAGVRSRPLDDLEEHIQGVDRLTLSSSFTGFRDADGTRYRKAEVAGALGWRMRGRAEASVGVSRLQSEGHVIDGRWGGLAIEQRFSESWALRAEGRLAEYLGAGFRPWTGELDAGWTPRDGSRVDLAAARLVIADNMAALRHHLQGNFTSAGITQSLDRHDTVSASLDATDWNQGNLRMRYRVDFAHRFEAVPGLEIEWPTLYQTYDRGFSFALFSPRDYIETGPALDWRRRWRRHYSLSLYARLGEQKEFQASWKKLGTFRAEAERELYKAWGVRLDAFWSSSDLASPTGFRRRSVSLSLTRKF